MSHNFSNFLRVFAAFAVVIIHSTAKSTNEFHASGEWFSIEGIGTAFNQWARFSVPLFLFLSGFGLMSSASSSQNFSVISFYRTRLIKVALPYFFYALIVILISWQGLTDAVDKGKSFLSFKSPDYHLYFIKIIVQCYILFPLLRLFPQLGCVIGGVFSLIYFFPGQIVFNYYFGVKPFYIPASVVFPWLPYFIFGMLFARKPEINMKTINILFLILISFFILLAEYSFRADSIRQLMTGSSAYYDHFHRYTVFFYSVMTFLVLYKFQPFNKIYKSKLLKQLCQYSFFIYLAHPMFLRFASLLGIDLFLFKALIGFFGSFLLGLFLHKVLKKGNPLRVLVGLS